MDENEIKNLISALEAEEADLESQLAEVASILKRQREKLILIKERNRTSAVSPDELQRKTFTNLLTKVTHPNFPSQEHLHDQIEFVMRELGRSVRKNDVVKKYEELSPEANSIEWTLRKMRKDEKIIAVKFNGNQIFYLLPEWVTMVDGKKAIKEQYRPSKKDLPTGYNTLEWI
ncbi:hypothetical protein [uncultured Imperialibacter sp.]|uniref:hypothetical protein n=1 Tax=uncultured Imperialibacter sp. TaxID=1672639 RepID=UPI0030D926D5|tara:strand:- start:49548 stop:50069 length:522 start_codon:yes stop_codon:yes gene_type:complete